MTKPDEYLDSIKERGFVSATKDVMVQVVENTESVEKLRTEMDAVVAVLEKRLEKLEKK